MLPLAKYCTHSNVIFQALFAIFNSINKGTKVKSLRVLTVIYIFLLILDKLCKPAVLLTVWTGTISEAGQSKY